MLRDDGIAGQTPAGSPRDAMEVVAEIQRLLKEGYDHYFATSDGHCKSSEGVVTLQWPTYFDFKDGRNEPSCSVYSYVLGPSRNHHFKTVNAALQAVRGWVRDELAKCPKCEARPSEFYQWERIEDAGCEHCNPRFEITPAERSEAQS